MTVTHHGIQAELDDSWWAEAGMSGFIPRAASYRSAVQAAGERDVFNVPIELIGPVHRSAGVAIFNADRDTGRSARERIVALLRGFVDDVPLPPVEVVSVESASGYRYKLVHGAHRLYCSIAAGFTEVPAVQGFDWSTLDRP